MLTYKKESLFAERLFDVQKEINNNCLNYEIEMEIDNFGILKVGEKEKRKVWNECEKFANYLLFASDVKEKKIEYNIFTDEKLFNQSIREICLSEDTLNILIDKVNTKQEKRLRIDYTKSEWHSISGIQSYQTLIDIIRYSNTKYGNRIMDEIKADQIELYKMIRKPIVAKKLGTESTEYYLENVNFLHAKTVKALIYNMSYQSCNLSGDLACIMMDFRNLLGRCDLSGEQLQFLECHKRNMRGTEISDFLKVSQSKVTRMRKKIIKIIIKKHREELCRKNIF